MNRNSIIVRSLIFISMLLILITPLFLALRYVSTSIPETKSYIGYVFIFISMILIQKYLYIIINKIYSYFNIVQTEEEKELYKTSDMNLFQTVFSIIINAIILIASVSILLFTYGLLYKYNVIIAILLSIIVSFLSFKGLKKGLNLLLESNNKK